MKENRVCWLSAGVSSFVAGVLGNADTWIYIDVADQHPDSMRFVKDCEKAIGQQIIVLKSKEFENVEDVCRKVGMVNSPAGAPCTGMLKKKVRKQWEHQYLMEHGTFEGLTYLWGYDVSERKRAEHIVENFPEFHHEFPLLERGMSKKNVHGYFDSHCDFKRPLMYDLGYSNNNCIGCVKGGMGYWNMIRRDFPEVFEARAKMERDVGHSCINGIFLDELEPNRGRTHEVMPECDLLCFLQDYD